MPSSSSADRQRPCRRAFGRRMRPFHRIRTAVAAVFVILVQQELDGRSFPQAARTQAARREQEVKVEACPCRKTNPEQAGIAAVGTGPEEGDQRTVVATA